MTWEEAIELLCYGDWLNVISEHIGKQDTERIAKAMCIVGKALHPVSREQVEKVWRGCEKCNGAGEYGRYAENLTKILLAKYCPHCGRPLTDEAVQVVMGRLEALFGERNDD